MTHTDYIYAPTGLAAICRQQGKEVLYVLADHMGSVQVLADAAGRAVTEYRYEAWGGRVLVSGEKGLTDRGYTGHEHLEPLGLIDMNGRIYDPTLARFLSPDPYVQAPDFTQGLNRYSYCLNNPFKYTDPSGEVFVLDDLILAAFIGGMINVAVQGFSGNIESAGDFWLSFGIGALGGLAGGMAGQAVASAISIGGAAAGAAIGATAGGISGFTVSSGNAWMNGANFWQGMAAGGIGLGIGTVSGGIVGGLSGGINARIHGGNFWNGIQVLESPTSGSANGDFVFNNDEELLAWVKESGIHLEDYNIDNLSAWKDPNLKINKMMYVRMDDG